MTGSDCFARYAVYWLPEDGSHLAAFGAGWLGHDPAVTGLPGQARIRLGLPDGFVDRVTTEPRRYGLHATLKAPFRLKAGATIGQLTERLRDLAISTPRHTAAPLRLTDLQGFLALCPSDPIPDDLVRLARLIVMLLDTFRAPLTEAERARRKPSALSTKQRQNLDNWGYPYVFDDFRFHITLTGRLSEDERRRVEPPLAAAVAQFCREPLAIASIALLGDPGDGRPFKLVQRFALSDPALFSA